MLKFFLILMSLPGLLFAGLTSAEIEKVKKEREKHYQRYSADPARQKQITQDFHQKQHEAWKGYHERESTYFQRREDYFKYSFRILLEEAYRLDHARLGHSPERDLVWRQAFQKIAHVTKYSAAKILEEISIMGIFSHKGPCFEKIEIQMSENLSRMQALLNQIAQQPEIDGKKSLFLNADSFWEAVFLELPSGFE